jgi:hypothetical protein
MRLSPIAARADPPYLQAMLRFIARFLGFWLVAAALVAAIVDGAKSIAASSVVITPLAETWDTIAALAGWQATAEALPAGAPWPLDVALPWLFATPTVGILAPLGVFFMVAGAKRRRHTIGREFAA